MSEGKYIENIGCTECGSSDAVGVYQNQETGEYYGICFSCNHKHKNPYNILEVTEEFEEVEIKEEEETKSSYNINSFSINPLVSRGISKGTCEKFGVKSKVDSDGNDEVHAYPHYLQDGSLAWCIREVSGKKFKWTSSPKSVKFFGQELAGSNGKMIIVTEGVCDCLAVVEMLGKVGKSYRTVSIVNGASAALKDFKTNFEWINSFENIFLAFDMDEPGQTAAKKVAEMFPPNKVKTISYQGAKDPNELLLSGRHQDFLNAIFSAKETKPDGIVSVEDIFDDAIKPPIMGLSWPWKSLTEVTYGYRRGELYGIGAGSGCGKTEFFKECIHHTINTHGLKAGVIFLEEPATKTLKVLAGKKVNKRFHIPADKGGDWTVEELVDGINDLKGKVYLYNHFGAKDWESIKSKIRFMVSALDIKDIYLDHLTALVAQEDNEYKALNKLMEEMSSLCQELDCTIFYVSHLRKASGTPHEEGGRVTADQFKGSGAIVFWSNFLIGLERNQQAEDEEERNTTTLRVLKDRNTGLATGTTFKLRYDHNTGRWGEIDEDEFNEDF